MRRHDRHTERDEPKAESARGSGYDVFWHGRKTPADMGIFTLSPGCATSSNPGFSASRFR